MFLATQTVELPYRSSTTQRANTAYPSSLFLSSNCLASLHEDSVAYRAVVITHFAELRWFCRTPSGPYICHHVFLILRVDSFVVVFLLLYFFVLLLVICSILLAMLFG
jgi:hypothetical protein